MSFASALTPSKLTDVDRHFFARMIEAQEALVTGRRAGARQLPRFIRARGMQASRRRLSDIDFTGSDLNGSAFVKTDLSRAVLFRASLRGCDFTHAILARADMRGACLSGAVLSGAHLDGADMRDAAMVFAGPGCPEAGNHHLPADQGADFTNCSMKGANLRNANLKGARFDNANLDGADLTGARTEGASFVGAILTNAKLGEFTIPRKALAGCILAPEVGRPDVALAMQIALADAETWVGTRGRLGKPANLSGLDMRLAGNAYSGRRLSGSDFSGVCGVAIDFSGSQLIGSNFDGADLRGANFQQADLRGASFRRANLAHANFLGADLDPMRMVSGQAKPVDFSGAILHGTGLYFEWLA